jgi:hypothetical protein
MPNFSFNRNYDLLNDGPFPVYYILQDRLLQGGKKFSIFNGIYVSKEKSPDY